MAGVAPACELSAGLLDHPGTDRQDQAGLLGQGDELTRRDHAAPGMLPASERFEAGDAAALGVHLRLVVEAELLAFDGAAQVGLERDMLARLCLPGGVGDARLILAGLSGAAGRRHGVGDELPGLLPVLGVVGDPDPGAEVQRLAGELPGAVEELHQADRETEDLGQVAHLRHDDREQVAADVGEGVGLAREQLHVITHHARQLFAGVEPEGGAHLGRLVEVDDDQRGEVLEALRLGDSHLKTVGEQEAVGQAGVGVVREQPGGIVRLAGWRRALCHHPGPLPSGWPYALLSMGLST